MGFPPESMGRRGSSGLTAVAQPHAEPHADRGRVKEGPQEGARGAGGHSLRWLPTSPAWRGRCAPGAGGSEKLNPGPPPDQPRKEQQRPANGKARLWLRRRKPRTRDLTGGKALRTWPRRPRPGVSAGNSLWVEGTLSVPLRFPGLRTRGEGAEGTHRVEELRGQAQVVVQSQKGDPLQPHHDDLEGDRPAEPARPRRQGSPGRGDSPRSPGLLAPGTRKLHAICASSL